MGSRSSLLLALTGALCVAVAGTVSSQPYPGYRGPPPGDRPYGGRPYGGRPPPPPPPFHRGGPEYGYREGPRYYRPPYYGPGPYYGGPPAYYAPPPVYAPPPGPGFFFGIP